MDSSGNTAAPPRTGRPVIFGEALYDTFPDGAEVLGGAPFNVAWHLQGFGLSPLFISRVGDDAAGRRVRKTMASWGMDTAGLQVDDRHPTGRVEVSIAGGQPRFAILAGQAYDFIAAPSALGAVSGIAPALLYHGTLAVREAASHDALRRLRAAGPPVFIDVNLRAPWWTQARVEELLEGARWVKLNDEELGELCPGVEVEAAARALFRRYGLELLIVTLGTNGAVVILDDGLTRGRPVVVDDLVDTVGAGDAFAAVMLYGLLCGWRCTVTLDHAMDFAAAVCRQRGATAADPALYREHRARWLAAQGQGAA